MDYQSFTDDLLNTDWEQLFEGMLVEEMWAIFHAKYMSLVAKNILLLLLMIQKLPLF